jgi:hypothetical protein
MGVIKSWSPEGWIPVRAGVSRRRANSISRNRTQNYQKLSANERVLSANCGHSNKTAILHAGVTSVGARATLLS